MDKFAFEYIFHINETGVIQKDQEALTDILQMLVVNIHNQAKDKELTCLNFEISYKDNEFVNPMGGYNPFKVLICKWGSQKELDEKTKAKQPID